MDNYNTKQIVSFLQELNTELELLQTKSLIYLGVIDINSPQIISLLELENRASTLFSPRDSIYSNLNHLKTLTNNLRSCQSYTPRSFIQRRMISYQIYSTGLIIQKEIQLCVDKENVRNLIKILQEPSDDEEKLRALDQFIGRISTGFDLELHLVNEKLFNDTISNIIWLLSSKNLQRRLMAMHCLIEMAYYSTKKVLEYMINAGLVEKLVLLQREEFRSDLSEVVVQMEEGKDIELCVGDGDLGSEEGESSSSNPFSGCIARLVVQVEVGEGMEKSERKEIKMMILRRVRAACVSEAEAATVIAEVLWGSHP